MNDRPTADELLEAVQEYLRDEVAPEAPTHRARFRALIAANVVAIVRRELARRDDPQEELAAIAAVLGEPVPGVATGDAGDAVRRANRRLAEHIRRGEADEGDHARAVRDLVRRLVERKLAISNPALLERYQKEWP